MKSFEQFRQELEEASPSDYAYQPRSPASQAFLNQHLLVKFNKLSIPVQDNNVFNAANLDIKQGKRGADKDNVDDQSAGYHTPVVFGDYVSRFMQMRTEGEDLSADEEDFLNEVLMMDLDELEDIVENTWKAGNDILSIKSDVHGHQVHVWSPVVGKFIPQGPCHKTRHEAVTDIEKGWKGIKEGDESFLEGSDAPLTEGVRFEAGKVYHQEYKDGSRGYFKPQTQLKNGRWSGLSSDSIRPKKAVKHVSDDTGFNWKETPSHEHPHSLREETITEGEESHFSMDVDSNKFSGRLKRMTKEAKGKFTFQVHTNPMFRQPGALHQDQFVMKLHGEDGRVLHLGTHPSLEGAKKFITHHTSGVKDD